ncbi:MAG: (2Fe-2S)-binding protein [Geodermatophilaceae bacterium]|jgi:bacterioferritin-associated ferredoxin|nr:(2Fe-2S)-binding protein [Geodermatophilaceae bacterium]MDQ3463862.1 (2Fe-2S)-binding protein [Actinomycetota bacterium]
MYVCICHAVTETQVAAAIAQGASTEGEVSDVTGAGTGCGGCLERICERLASADSSHLVSHAVALSA